VHIFGYAVAPRGIVYHGCVPRVAATLRSATGRSDPTGRAVGTVAADVIAGLSVSPDGQSVVYGGGLLTSDLMMIEHFR
jgi:hypothetical protein